MPLSAYLTQLCTAVGLESDWQQAATKFHAAGQVETGQDEMSLFEAIWDGGRETAVLIPNALRILCQMFLRHYPLWQAQDPLWQEMALEERLPLAQFMDDLNQHAENQSVKEWLASVYRSYCLGQHEIIALQKLRYNKYNTFKFYYQDDEFAWANNPAQYKVPLRFPGLRLFNGLTILTDLGLIIENEEGICALTTEGETYLARAVEGANDD